MIHHLPMCHQMIHYAHHVDAEIALYHQQQLTENTMDDQRRLKMNADFALEQFDDEVLLYSLDRCRAVYLNTTASLIYGLYSAGQSEEEIVALLEEGFPEQKECIREDVTSTLRQLTANEVMLPYD
ncbi:MAG: hypothetical protein BWK76_01095 [Desulfobulbaceae bacterium A2]|nr:MAG: hypothetical protein BWK76_01095 [Desulfobulbaceae bacterium A2]